MSELSKTVGMRIRTIRKSKKLSQEALAFEADMHPAQIGQIERGENNPTIDTLDKILSAMDSSFTELFSFENKAKNETTEIQMFLSTLSNSELNDIATILLIMKKWKTKSEAY